MKIFTKTIFCTALISSTLVASSAQSSNIAYVTKHNSDQVSAVNLTTNTLVQDITVGDAPFKLVASPSGDKIYVLNSNSDNVSVVSTVTNTVVDVISVKSPGSAQHYFYGIYLANSLVTGSRLYVAEYKSGAGNTINIIDLATRQVTSTLYTPATGLLSIAVKADGSKMYIATKTNNSILVLDMITNQITSTVPCSSCNYIFDIKLSASENELYLTNYNSGNLSVLNLASGAITATIPINGSPTEIVVKDTRTVFVACRGIDAVAKIDIPSNTVQSYVNVGKDPLGLDISADGCNLYVVNSFINTMSVINTSTNTVTNTIALQSGSPSFVLLPKNYLACAVATQNTTDATFALTVAPNPMQNSTVFEYATAPSGNEKTILGLRNALGQTVKTITFTDGKATLYRDNLPEGCYFYTITNNNTIVNTGKLIME